MNCNIIIPTHNRPRYLQRILDYYSKYANDFEIIVVDSSSKENKKLNKKIISSFANLKIQYVDNYASEINPHHKFADMVNYAKEKYCVFCADDDFITPRGIRKSVEFLEKNPDFTAADGKIIAFCLKNKEENQQFYWKFSPLYKSITSQKAEKRLFLHLSAYDGTIYAAHRTDFAKMIYKELLKSKVDPLLFGELLPSMLTLIYGKMKHLDVLYMARESHSPCAYWPTLGDFKRKGKYDAEYKKFRNCLANHLSKKSQLGIKESKRVVDKAMSAHIKPYHFLVSGVANILHKLNMSDWIYKKISLLYRRLFSLPKKEYYSNSTNDLPTKYYNDFNKIRTCVISHAIKNNKK
jgi:glycosyltransferase domain-containing protein